MEILVHPTAALAKCLVLFLACSGFMLADAVQWTVAEGGNGNYFEVLSAPGGITWSGASAIATADGGYLASITSAAENNFVFTLIDNSNDYTQVSTGGGSLRALGPWIGGYRTGSGPSDFAWVNGDPFGYTDWASGEPSDTNGDENNIQYLYKCGIGVSPCTPLAPTWNDLSSSSDTFYGQLPVAYVVEFDSAPAPEPATLALGAGGIALIAWMRRKRAHRRGLV
jgi:hypothetical protein